MLDEGGGGGGDRVAEAAPFPFLTVVVALEAELFFGVLLPAAFAFPEALVFAVPALAATEVLLSAPFPFELPFEDAVPLPKVSLAVLLLGFLLEEAPAAAARGGSSLTNSRSNGLPVLLKCGPSWRKRKEEGSGI